MAKDDKKEGEESGGKSGGGGLLPLINLVLLVLLLGIGGFNTWTLMQMDKPAPTEAVKPTADTLIPEAVDPGDGPAVEMELDDVTVNLADANRYLKVTIKLSLRNEEAKIKIEEKKSEINDLLITLMSGKHYDDISTPLGKYELKEELVHRINKAVGGNPVRKLFFTDFVSQ
ncbi:MAG: flagellar protein FliL [Zetaproteobacteria bacterium CG06_land_8_20_14_3_00_59_53]|nr:MAG: flagellar protein FliL [Zetaproteobacteria bacterium CG2_30_59_37]PIO88715.1 MAG: flagellar protein FliL [Zetaproteobacteria bacterium CG23_combo_of_CG06-09_8_20_14_all_59_86]PIQ65389.1 MAG: flagellar protein FliL [Zetaproteobacteria bacterium CG11_big_fil_rev_8_21_14_0_20_59_439]PIU69641.1 MAG: flagellar protein FliL [Zetaproteobacteria bacterium CG06_land_8_20_14_3_00_59_53]PIU96888.1 MAG: flagellar protein FliL [Zetaproteobacteria bacterium CG03_land_8_20_14_0_80_59_51]PIY47556.1 MA